MSRYLLVNQHYWPDLASTGQHLTDLAEHLAEHGHEVRVLCAWSPGAEQGIEPERKQTHGGVRIERVGRSRVGCARGSRRSLVARFLDYACFHLAVALRVLCARRTDVIVSLSTPPLIGLWATIRRVLGGPKSVLYIMDHHPDAEFELGIVERRSLLGRMLEATYGWMLRSADLCVHLGPWQAERTARRGVRPERSTVIPIWTVQEDRGVRPHDQNPLRARFGWEQRFVVLYSGNAGLVHTFDELIEAARVLEQTHPDVLFAFIGGGERRAEIVAQTEGAGNVRFYDSVARAELGLLLGAADVHFISLRPEQVGVSVPGKLYGQLASGRPVLFVGPEQCESAADLRAAKAGCALPPGCGRELAAEIAGLSEDAERCAELGASGRAWALENASADHCCELWRAELDALLGKPGRLLALPTAQVSSEPEGKADRRSA